MREEPDEDINTSKRGNMIAHCDLIHCDTLWSLILHKPDSVSQR